MVWKQNSCVHCAKLAEKKSVQLVIITKSYKSANAGLKMQQNLKSSILILTRFRNCFFFHLVTSRAIDLADDKQLKYRLHIDHVHGNICFWADDIGPARIWDRWERLTDWMSVASCCNAPCSIKNNESKTVDFCCKLICSYFGTEHVAETNVQTACPVPHGPRSKCYSVTMFLSKCLKAPVELPLAIEY